MGQLIRQIGVVIGLTVILTFPVTVVSGAGSQKHSEHGVRMLPAVGKISTQAQEAARIRAETGTPWYGRHEHRR